MKSNLGAVGSEGSPREGHKRFFDDGGLNYSKHYCVEPGPGKCVEMNVEVMIFLQDHCSSTLDLTCILFSHLKCPC